MSTATMNQHTSSRKSATRTEEQFCTFRLGGLLFGVEVLCVQEVLLTQEMTRIPLAHAVIKGLINLRGQIVTAIDLRTRLGMEPLDSEKHPMNVVVRSGETAFSLVVDEIGDVVDVDAESFEEPPETLTGHARDLILGAYKLERELLLVLDTEKATAIAAAASTH